MASPKLIFSLAQRNQTRVVIHLAVGEHEVHRARNFMDEGYHGLLVGSPDHTAHPLNPARYHIYSLIFMGFSD